MCECVCVCDCVRAQIVSKLQMRYYGRGLTYFIIGIKLRCMVVRLVLVKLSLTVLMFSVKSLINYYYDIHFPLLRHHREGSNE